MIFQEKKITIKNGMQCVLRSAQPGDAEDLLKYLKITARETPYLVREAEEVTLTLEQEKAYLNKAAQGDRELLLIGRVNGRHVGNCSLMPVGSFKRYAHRCGVSIALYQEYCGLGIGKAMLETILAVAKECGYEQAELEVVATNEPAVRLYTRLGFQIHGTLPHNMKYSDGSYADVYWMRKELRE